MGRKESAILDMSHSSIKSTRNRLFRHAMAVNLLANMGAELNSTYMTELCDPLIMENERGEKPVSSPDSYKFGELKLVFIVGSHAYCMVMMVDNLGIDMENLSVTGFGVSDNR
jgi:hypothetical protein